MRQFMDSLIDIVRWIKSVTGYAREKADKAADVIIEKAGLDKIESNPELDRRKLQEAVYRDEIKKNPNRTEDDIRARWSEKLKDDPKKLGELVDWHVARFRNASDAEDL